MNLRSLISHIAGYFQELSTLEYLEKILLEDRDIALKEVRYRIEFVKLCNSKGDPKCKHCKGVGFGCDGRGDPWTCFDCKPVLKTFWNDK